MVVQPVDVAHIHMVWDQVEPYLERGQKFAGDDFTVDQIKVYLTTGMWQLIVFADEKVIKGAITVDYTNRPNNRVAFVTNFGGVDVVNEDNLEQFKAIVTAGGATAIEAACRPSAERLFEQKLGATRKFSVIEVKL